MTHNLRGAGWAPDGSRALFVGNRRRVLRYDGCASRDALVNGENLRRIAWAPDGSCALIAGNAGCRAAIFETPLRARCCRFRATAPPAMRSIAWRPDGAYALIGAYASRFAGYPRPHLLYRCDGRYMQGILSTDDEDDAIAIDWRPGAVPGARRCSSRRTARACAARTSSSSTRRRLHAAPVDAPATLLGPGWRPTGATLLLCGERGTLIRVTSGDRVRSHSGTRDNLVGPFWRPGGGPLALMLKGPDERVYTV